ncbi:MAG: hypothetical protein MUO43_11655 [Desulfobacterales bacterium]|nr:hypothetical protein [Desulfobacterales bacterium]
MKRVKIIHVFRNPTDLELGMLYFLLGINMAYATDAVVSLSYYFLVGLTVLLLLVVGVFRLIIFVLAVLSEQIRMSSARWIQIVLIGAAIAIILGTNFDLALRVRLSEQALYKKVQRIQMLPPEAQNRMANSISSGPIGLFNARLYAVDASTGIIWFHTADGRDAFPPPHSLFGGIVYCEEGTPPKRGESTYQHLYGPWWRWLQDF